MGCGCGQPKMANPNQAVPTGPIVLQSGSATPVQRAMAYQSATMPGAPTGPVVERTTV